MVASPNVGCFLRLSSIRKNYYTDFLLLTSRKKSVRKKEKSNTCKLGKIPISG